MTTETDSMSIVNCQFIDVDVDVDVDVRPSRQQLNRIVDLSEMKENKNNDKWKTGLL